MLVLRQDSSLEPEMSASLVAGEGLAGSLSESAFGRVRGHSRGQTSAGRRECRGLISGKKRAAFRELRSGVSYWSMFSHCSDLHHDVPPKFIG